MIAMMLRHFTQKYYLQRHSNVHNQGWTLIEIGVVTVIVGILAAMAFPSLAGIQARGQLRSASNDVKGALGEAQKNAIKRGASCRVDITEASGIVTSTTTTGCINNPVNLSTSYNGMTLTSLPANLTRIDFSYKGNPTFFPSSTTDQIIRIQNPTRTSDVRCVVISYPLGIIRSGNFNSTSNLCEGV